MGTIGKDRTDGSGRRRPPAIILARAAAYIDGEGCISIGRTTHTENPNPAFFLHVLADNTDPRLPYWMRGWFGGRVHELPITPGNKKNKALRYRWQIDALDRQRFLQWIRPYALIKREQVDVALRFLRLQSGVVRKGRKGGGVEPHKRAYIARLRGCFEELRKLRTERFLRSVHPQRLSEAARRNTGGMR